MYVHHSALLVFLANPRTASRSIAKALTEQAGFVKVGAHHHAPWRQLPEPRRYTSFSVVRNLEDTIASWCRKYGGISEREFLRSKLPQQRNIIEPWPPHSLFPWEHQSDSILRYEELPSCLNDLLRAHELEPVTLPTIR